MTPKIHFLRRNIALLGVAAASLAGCNADAPNSPRFRSNQLAQREQLTAAAQAEVQAAVAGRTTRGFEDEILRLEADIPGLGGLYVDAESTPTIWLKNSDATDIATVKSRLNVLGNDARLSGPLAVGLRAGRLKVLKGKFSFSEVVAASHAIAKAIIRPGSISAFDADERLNRVRIGVKSLDAEPAIREQLAGLNLPDSIVTFELGEPINALTTLRQSYRPTGGGQQINLPGFGYYKRCTLGYNVKMTFYSDSGALTASHCEAQSVGSGTTGGAVQQLLGAGQQIGNVTLNPAFNYSDPGCLTFTLCTLADVMYVQMGSTWARRYYEAGTAATGSATGTITMTAYWNSMNVIGFIYTGLPAYKVGRTTGYTAGTVGATCNNILVDSLYMVLCSDRVDGAGVGQGDSGAGVFALGPFDAMGILFASDTNKTYDIADDTWRCTSNCRYYFSNWNQVQTHLSRYFAP